MTDEELRQHILEKGILGKDENLRIHDKFFKGWRDKHSYIYRKFQIDFNAPTLDIGCGYGNNLIHFSKDSAGIETSQPQVDFARSLGLDVTSLNAEDDLLKLNRKFDFIWCTDFLVHMVSPFKFLYDCRGLLNDNGRILIQVPLMSVFNTHRSPCHFYGFNKKSLLYLMEMAGYEVLGCSGYIRNKPAWFNAILEPVLQIWGGNIWVIARKQEKNMTDFNRSFLPKWFNP